MRRPGLTIEAVVAAVGSSVVVDDGRGILEEVAEVVDAAAHAEAIGRLGIDRHRHIPT